MIVQQTTPGRTFWVRLNPHDDLLLGLRAAVKEAGITNGVILGGVGSLTSYHFHVVSSVELPPENAFERGSGPFDILNVNGAILGGRVHAHITFSNTDTTLGGHLEEGTTVLTFAIIMIQETPDVDLALWDRVGVLDA
ncbi:MAG TPA: PPC domain-containing DNA-binding protein [Thermomicrobiales bacterium]|nr:PPC domain-containing DNA-binding protein [Thermomicrobiales bacterium]